MTEPIWHWHWDGGKIFSTACGTGNYFTPTLENVTCPQCRELIAQLRAAIAGAGGTGK
jgi:hypothetical protein